MTIDAGSYTLARTRRELRRKRVLRIVLDLWSARKAGDLRDVSREYERLYGAPNDVTVEHELSARPRIAAALRALRRRGSVGWLRGRGWFPEVDA